MVGHLGVMELPWVDGPLLKKGLELEGRWAYNRLGPWGSRG